MKVNDLLNEDLSIKQIKKDEIDLLDPSADEVKALKSDSPIKRNKIIKKIEQDMKESVFIEKTYSAKEARKGKDIGKPGKNFNKIADNAAKKYGSKESGEKVAGAILSKLRNEGSNITEATKKTDPQADYDAGYRYYVIDSQSKKIIGKYKSGSTALCVVDKKDNEYGAYRYRRQPIDLIIKGISKNPAITEDNGAVEQIILSPELLLRTMEWAKECGDEGIQFHKYVELMSQLAGEKGSLGSDDHETILSLITSNNPKINNEGSGVVDYESY